MLTNRQLFFQHVAIPSSQPLALEIEKAEGIYIFDIDGKRYCDLVSGVSVSNLGHRHPKIVQAIKDQLDKYMHLMVYGKYIQTPQVQLATELVKNLPKNLSSVYFVNSGSESIEGAMKLAKRNSGKTEIIAFKNAYHGGTQGALSVFGDEKFKQSFRPLLPAIRFLEFNNYNDLEKISIETACVIIEPIQSEAGVILPEEGFLINLKKRCVETETLLIFDEVQLGFGRTGSLFCFEQFNVIPDILCLAKAMGGGMPIGAFISSKKNMSKLTYNPELGHITTFGGHPVCCAAALANLKELIDTNLIPEAKEKGEMFKDFLKNHPVVKEIRGKGLMIAVELDDIEKTDKLVNLFVENGIIVDRFIFCPTAFRIAPPLIISNEEIKYICKIILKCFDKII